MACRLNPAAEQVALIAGWSLRPDAHRDLCVSCTRAARSRNPSSAPLAFILLRMRREADEACELAHAVVARWWKRDSRRSA